MRFACRHFRTSLTSPGCGKNNAGHPPNGFTNDGLVDVRFLIGGRHVPSPQLEYVQTLDARSPWIPLDVNRCEVTGDVDTFGGWCANTAEDLQHTSVGTVNHQSINQSIKQAAMFVFNQVSQLNIRFVF